MFPALPLLVLAACGGASSPGNTVIDNRLALASELEDGSIAVAMSPDGLWWTAPEPLRDESGAPYVGSHPTLWYVSPTSGPGDGVYHLTWVDPALDVRHAWSSDAVSWYVDVTQGHVDTDEAVVLPGPDGGLVAIEGGDGLGSIDLDYSPNHGAVTEGEVYRWSAVAGADELVVAAMTPAGIVIYASDNGYEWAERATLSTYRMSASWPQLSRTAGGLRLLVQTAIKSDDSVGYMCTSYLSDDLDTWTEEDSFGCSDGDVYAAELDGDRVVLTGDSVNLLELAASSSGPPSWFTPTALDGLAGAPSLAVGRGPMLAGIRVDRVTNYSEGSQDIALVPLGFHVRVGGAGHSRVTMPGELVQIAEDLAPNDTVEVPAAQAPLGWVVTPAVDVDLPTGEVDLMGTFLVGVERGSCPADAVLDAVRSKADRLEAALDRYVAPLAPLDLRDEEVRATVEADILAYVNETDSDAAGDPFAWIGCAFNEDSPTLPHSVLVVGTPLIDEPDQGTYGVGYGTERTLNDVELVSEDGEVQWTVGLTLWQYGE